MKKRRWLWRTPLILLAVILVTTVAAWWWLTGTRAGAEWMLERAAGAEPTLDWSRLEGNLSGGIVLTGVRAEPAGTAIRAERVELAARLSLLPQPKLTVDWLRVRDARVELPPGETAETTSGPFALPEIELPLVVEIRELAIAPLVVLPSPGGEAVTIDRIAAAARIDRKLELESLVIEHTTTRLEAAGSAGLTRPWPLDLGLSLEHALPDDRPVRIEIELDGPVADLAANLRARGALEADADLAVTGLPGLPGINGTITAGTLAWPGVPGRIENLDLAVAGDPGEWRVSGGLAAHHPDYPPADLELELAGTPDRLRAERLDIDWLGGRIGATGEVELGGDWNGHLDLDIADLHIDRLYPDGPVSAPVRGHVSLSHEAGRIRFSELSMSAPPLPLSVSGEGLVDIPGDRVDVNLAWRDFQWPPGAQDDSARVTSRNGSLALTGRLSDWQAQLEAVVSTPRIEQARVGLEATGDRTSARIRRLQIDGTPGRLNAEGDLAWSPRLAADITVRLEDIDPGVLDARMSGTLTGNADLAVNYTEQGTLDAEIIIPELTGTWRSRAVHAAGRLTLRDGTPGPTDLELALGDNRLTLDSDAGQAWAWTLDAGALAQLWPALSGALDLKGRLVPAERSLTVEGTGEGLAWESYQVATLDITGDWRLSPKSGRLDTRVDLSGVALKPWERYESVSLRIRGDCRNHDVRLTADGDRGRLELDGGSRLDTCPPDFAGWGMTLDTLAVTGTDAGDWRLAEAASVDFDPARGVSAESLCLVPGDRSGARLCLEGENMDTASGTARVSLRDLPVDVLLLPFNPGYSLDNTLTGDIGLGWQSGGLTRADGRITASSGRWQQAGPDRPGLDIGGAELNFSLDDEATTLRADLSAQLEGRTRVRGQARLAGVRDLGSARLESSLQLDVPDLSVFTRLTPEIDRLGGRLDARLETAGALDGLSTRGELTLREGHVLHAPYGMELTDIELTARSGAAGMTLDGSFAAGEGRGRIQGELSGDDTPVITLDLEGERLALFDADWLELTASPDLDIRVEGRDIRLGGRLDIPRARIGLPPGAENRVSASPDVILAGSGPGPDDSAAGSGLNMQGAITVALGDDVRFASAGAETDLTGEVRLEWNGEELVPEGDGLIRLRDGTYQAYGQNLEIRSGEIIFSERSVANPRLDIEAVREIFGDPVVAVAGVSITGYARRPEIELFTDPPTSRDKALAYVATGSNFDHASGVGAFNLGFYLLPDLFVSYGIGLFESGNVLSARYELSRRWGVRAQSGERDTGVDFSYVLDH